jgi:hypothetical protein
MKARIRLRIKCSNSRIASILEKVLAPDNRDIPEDQKLEMVRRRDVIEITIISSRLGSALTSARSIVSDVKLFSRVTDALGV